MLLRTLAILVLLTTPALADAVTYRGMVGTDETVLELSSDIAAPLSGTVGRFFAISRGVDTPLHFVSTGTDQLDLIEELPCSTAICAGANPKPPLGPIWHLETNDDGATISGTRRVAGTVQPVTLTRIAKRPLQVPQANLTPFDLYVAPVDFDLDNAPLTVDSSPYDYLRLTSQVEEGPVTYWQDMEWRMATDPRIGLALPRLVSTGGGDLTAANDWLEQRQFLFASEAYFCAAKDFITFGWTADTDFVTGSFAGYEYEYVEVTMMNPSILSWTEEGSIGCFDAPPLHHRRVLNLDLATGRPFDLSLIFKGWVPEPGEEPVPLDWARSAPTRYNWGPDEELTAFVLANRQPHPDPQIEAGCDYPALMPYLAIGFRQSGRAYFTLDDLPDFLGQCAYDMLEKPLEDLAPLLADTAGDYFWGLPTTKGEQNPS